MHLLPVPDAAAELALYVAAEALVAVGGPGAGLAVAPEVVDVLQWRLYGAGVPAPSAQHDVHAVSKKRRRGKAAAGGGDVHGAAQALKLRAAAGSVLVPQLARLQAALLRLLATLLRTAGQLLPAATRLQLDAMACHMACAVESAMLRARADAVGDAAPFSALLVVACEALLASLQSPCGHRPPLLAPAMALFQRNAGSCDLPLRRACATALASLEGHTHPKSVATPVPLAPGAMVPARVLGTLDVLTADAVVLDAALGGGDQDEEPPRQHAPTHAPVMPVVEAPAVIPAAQPKQVPAVVAAAVDDTGHEQPVDAAVGGRVAVVVNGVAAAVEAPQSLPAAGAVFGVPAASREAELMEDSDGPLPEIDSGSSSDDDEEEAVE